MSYLKYSLFILSFLMFSCTDLIIGEDLASTNARENFEYLWNECNEKYTFFELKEIDWQQVFDEYSPLVDNVTNDEELFRTLGDMLNELQDGHVNLVSDFNVSFFPFDLDRPDNFDFRIIEENYLPRDHFISGPFRHDFIANGQVGYIRFGSFSGQVAEDNIGFVLERYQDTRGLIIDLRENGGGRVSDLFSILRRFVPNEQVVFRSRIKTGIGVDDFSDLEDAVVSPTNGVSYTGRVMVLVDRGTFSAGSFFALAAKSIPNMTLIGDITGGGLGAPNGGQLPNGWTYRFSITQTLDLNGNNYENGVPVDIEAFLDLSDRTTDEVIERALEELL